MTRDPGDPKILGSVNEIVKSMPPLLKIGGKQSCIGNVAGQVEILFT